MSKKKRTDIIEAPYLETCPDCRGSCEITIAGETRDCGMCDGTGEVLDRQAMLERLEQKRTGKVFGR